MGSDFFGFSVHVYLREDFPKFLSGDFFCELNSAGIKRLKEYFSSHLAGLKLGGVCNDLVYFPLSGDLKFRFMDGEVMILMMVVLLLGCFLIAEVKRKVVLTHILDLSRLWML